MWGCWACSSPTHCTLIRTGMKSHLRHGEVQLPAWDALLLAQAEHTGSSDAGHLVAGGRGPYLGGVVGREESGRQWAHWGMPGVEWHPLLPTELCGEMSAPTCVHLWGCTCVTSPARHSTPLANPCTTHLALALAPDVYVRPDDEEVGGVAGGHKSMRVQHERLVSARRTGLCMRVGAGIGG